MHAIASISLSREENCLFLGTSDLLNLFLDIKKLETLS